MIVRLNRHSLLVDIIEEMINLQDLMFLSHLIMKNAKWIILLQLHLASNKFIHSSLLPLISSLQVILTQEEETISHLEVNRIFSSTTSITMWKTKTINRNHYFIQLSLTRKILEEVAHWTAPGWQILWVSKGATKRNISLLKNPQSIKLYHSKIQSKADFRGLLSLIQVR